MPKAPARTSTPQVVKLWPPQQQLVRDYVAAVDVAGGDPKIFNEHYPQFETMVLSLPNCSDIGSGDVLDIAVTGALRHMRRFLKEESEEKEGKVTLKEAIARTLASELIQFLESLPRTYLLRVGLPGMPNWGPFSIELAEDIVLRATGVAEPSAPVNRVAGIISGAMEAATDRPVSMSLELKIAGFASRSPDSPGVTDGLAVAKQCAYLFETTRVIRSARWAKRRAAVTLIDTLTGEEQPINLGDGLSHLFGGLEVKLDELVTNTGLGLLSLTQPAVTNEDRIAALASHLEPVRNVYSKRHLKGFQRIAAAIEWHQDSLADQDQTMAFLAACIGLESVFGEEKSAISELSNRLVDRYAFMLGKDRDHREQLSNEFQEVLRTRGELVHARKRRFRGREREQLAGVRLMLENSINHELRPFIAA